MTLILPILPILFAAWLQPGGTIAARVWVAF